MAGSPEHAASAKADQLLDQFVRQVRRTIQNAGRDQVHDLRVAARRLAQMVAVLENASAVDGAGKIRRALKGTIGLAGAVRDCDITQKLIAKLSAPVRLKNRLRRRRRKAESELTAALRALMDGGFAQQWRRKLHPQNGAITAAERQTLIRAADRLFKRAASVEGNAPRALHRLRIAAKKLRYTMELLAFPPARLEPIRQLQTRLGVINDYESARRMVAKEGASKSLINALAQGQERKARQFRRFWKREFAGKEDGWRAILTPPIRNR